MKLRIPIVAQDQLAAELASLYGLSARQPKERWQTLYTGRGTFWSRNIKVWW